MALAEWPGCRRRRCRRGSSGAVPARRPTTGRDEEAATDQDQEQRHHGLLSVDVEHCAGGVGGAPRPVPVGSRPHRRDGGAAGPAWPRPPGARQPASGTGCLAWATETVRIAGPIVASGVNREEGGGIPVGAFLPIRPEGATLTLVTQHRGGHRHQHTLLPAVVPLLGSQRHGHRSVRGSIQAHGASYAPVASASSSLLRSCGPSWRATEGSTPGRTNWRRP